MENLQSALREYLEADEQLLWTGKPRPGVVFRRMDLFTIPFSIIWCGFAIFWVTAAWSSAGVLFALFGLPFVVMGLVFVFGRFMLDARRRKNTIYGITNRRVLVRTGGFSTSLSSVHIKLLQGIHLKENKNGSGSISFGNSQEAEVMSNMPTWMLGSSTTIVKLDQLQNPRSVYRQLVSLQHQLLDRDTELPNN